MNAASADRRTELRGRRQSSRRRTGIVVASIIGIATALLTATEVSRSSSVSAAVATRSVQASRADDFVESIGVNTHHNYFDKPYKNWDMVKQRLSELGIRYVRDHVYVPSRLNELASIGVGVVGIMDARIGGQRPDRRLLSFAKFDQQWANLKQVRNLIAIEGPNEYDDTVSDWVAVLRKWMERVRSARDADPQLRNYPILSPSMGHAWATAVQLGSSVADLVDGGSFHPYPGGEIPTNQLDDRIAKVRLNAGSGKPIYATETGYHYSLSQDASMQPGVTNRVGGKYTPRLYAEYFKAGITKTFNYELMSEGSLKDSAGAPIDDPSCSECLYGLLDSNFNYRPAGTAVKQMIGLLGERGQNSFAPGSLSYGVDGDTRNMHDLLLQKSDGTFYLMLWNNISLYRQRNVGELPYNEPRITLRLPNNYQVVRVHRFNDAGELRSETFPITNGAIGINLQPAVTIFELRSETANVSAQVNGAAEVIDAGSPQSPDPVLTPLAVVPASVPALDSIGTPDPVLSAGPDTVIDPDPLAGPWRLAWSDEFDDESLDESKWAIEVGGNIRKTELQLFRAENVSVRDGSLVIGTNRENVIGPDRSTGTDGPFEYTSGSVTSSGRFSFRNGGIDVRAKLPVGKGIWPVLWLLGDRCPRRIEGQTKPTCQWPNKGAEEIDLVEVDRVNGGVPNGSQTLHTAYYGDSSVANGVKKSDCKIETAGLDVSDWHQYSVAWKAINDASVAIVWLIDDQRVCEKTIDAPGFFRSPMYIYLNTAIGVAGNPNASTPLPNEMQIDYVRVFDRSE